jgi:hypothetical protein
MLTALWALFSRNDARLCGNALYTVPPVSEDSEYLFYCSSASYKGQPSIFQLFSALLRSVRARVTDATYGISGGERGESIQVGWKTLIAITLD